MRKKNSFAKIGTIIMAMVVGLGFMGVGVSYWSQTLNIMTGMQVGTVETELSCDGCSPGISCDVTNNEMKVTVEDIEDGVNYSCQFHIDNGGTIPVKVLKQELTSVSDNTDTYTLTTPETLTACQWYYVDMDTLTVDTAPQASDAFAFHLSAYAPFQQIDPGDTEDGTVEVYLTDSDKEGDDFDFTVSFEVVRWNQ